MCKIFEHCMQAWSFDVKIVNINIIIVAKFLFNRINIFKKIYNFFIKFSTNQHLRPYKFQPNP
jgi:hypothetical protein